MSKELDDAIKTIVQSIDHVQIANQILGYTRDAVVRQVRAEQKAINSSGLVRKLVIDEINRQTREAVLEEVKTLDIKTIVKEEINAHVRKQAQKMIEQSLK